MKKYGLLAIILFGLGTSVFCADNDTALRLPRNTIFYTRLNLPGLGVKTEAYAEKLYASFATLGKLAEGCGLDGEACASLSNATIHFAVYLLEKPVILTNSADTPKFDPQTGKMLEGEKQSYRWTKTKRCGLVLFLDCGTTGETGKLFVGLADFLQRAGCGIIENGLDGEKFFSVPEIGLYFRPRENFLIFYDSPTFPGEPVGGAEGIAGFPVYQAYGVDAGAALSLFMNFPPLLKYAEDYLKEELQSAGAKAENATEEEREPAREELAEKRVSCELFLSAKRLLGLDGLSALCLNWRPHTAGANLRGGLDVTPEPRALLKLLLASEADFRLVAQSRREDFCLTGKLDFGEMLAQGMLALEPEQARALEEAIGEAGAAIGVDLFRLLGEFSGRFLLSLCFPEKTFSERALNPATGKMETVERREERPEFFLKLELNDGEKFAPLLTSIFGKLIVHPATAGYVSRKTTETGELFVLGNIANQNPPDGLTSFAVAARGNALVFGEEERLISLSANAKQEDLPPVRPAAYAGMVPVSFKRSLLARLLNDEFSGEDAAALAKWLNGKKLWMSNGEKLEAAILEFAASWNAFRADFIASPQSASFFRADRNETGLEFSAGVVLR